MPTDILFIGIAQLAVVVAGFAAIASALGSNGSAWTPAHRIRLRAIVSTSFNVMFESLLPVILFPALGDSRGSLVLASALVAAYVAFVIAIRGRQMARANALRAPAVQVMLAASIAAILLFASNALLFASPTAYALALCLQLLVAAISFYTLVASSTS